jgi:NAD(P)-dependent dehydrogenase (short-subunit alcohol dehydrogenase family)
MGPPSARQGNVMMIGRDRRALVTGANGGLGRAIADRLARDGYSLVLTDVHDVDHGANGDVSRREYRRCDLSVPAEVEALLSDIAASGDVDILINNAALLTPTPLDELDLQTFSRFMRINVEAPYQLAIGLYPSMARKGFGRILNVVSGSPWFPRKTFTGYVTSKMGLIGLTRVLAHELGDRNITVNAVTPGLTRHRGNFNELPEEVWQAIQAQQAIDRPAKPEDLAGIVLFLISDDASFITGQTMAADGGLVHL